MIRLYLFVFLLLSPLFFWSQVVINEISSTNVSTVYDDDGDAEDWIELYNPTGNVVDLTGYSFTYYDDKPREWTFPNMFMQPYEHLLVFASGKDRRDVIDHYEVPVYFAFPWRYFVGTSEPDSNWRYPGYNDASWLQGIGGIGYGDGDDSTVIPVTTSLYMRYSFVLPDTSKIALGIVLADFDDGIVLYLNGVEIGRSNVGIQGVPTPYNTLAYEEREAQMYLTGDFSAYFWLDHAKMRTAMKQGTNVLAVQTHNVLPNSDDMSSIVAFVTGKTDTSVTFFPIPVDFSPHTNFTLRGEGFKLTLKDQNGNVVDEKVVSEMHANNSFGRKTDGASQWVYFLQPTPRDTNATSAWYNGYAGVPEIMLKAGFYSGTQTTTFNAPSNGVVRYTIDGSEPTGASMLYTGPVSIDSTLVLRARFFSNDPLTLPGRTVTNTYFINETITMPVVSLSTDPGNLFNWNYGIYVMGPNADTAFPYYGANFWQGWERPGHTEFFEASGGQGFELDNVLKIHGNWSKGFPQRSFRVVANDDYGSSSINYKLFPEKSISRFRAFNIRNAGIDWNTTHMRDQLMNRALRKTHSMIMDGYHAVVFLNGQYWGVYEIREREDKYYIEENEQVDPDRIDLLRFYGDVQEGSNVAFREMVEYIMNNDMSIPANYQRVKDSLLDIENVVDYFASEIYYSNPDWLGNNIKFWRVNNPPGKWKYILWDMDGGLGLFSSVNDNLLPYVTNADTNSMYYGNPHSFMMQSLFDNLEFRNYFINRYADLMNTTLHPNSLLALGTEIYNDMLPEMGRHFALWGNPNTNPYGFGSAYNVPMWQSELNALAAFITQRPPAARNFVQAEWNLAGQVDVTLDVFPPGSGYIKMNTIVPDSFPWTGVYFNGVPVTMTAYPYPGYKFSYWQSPNFVSTPSYSPGLTLNVSANEPFTANFIVMDFDLVVYPNPSSDKFNLTMNVPEEKQVKLSVYDVLGKCVAVIVPDNSFTGAGSHQLVFDPREYSLPSGVYSLLMEAGEFTKAVKLVFSRSQ